jgi:hypothetical protein
MRRDAGHKIRPGSDDLYSGIRSNRAQPQAPPEKSRPVAAGPHTYGGLGLILLRQRPLQDLDEACQAFEVDQAAGTPARHANAHRAGLLGDVSARRPSPMRTHCRMAMRPHRGGDRVI